MNFLAIINSKFDFSVGNLTRRSQYRIEKDAEYGNGVYLKERTALLMDIKRLTIEYDFFKKQLNKENREKDPKKAEASLVVFLDFSTTSPPIISPPSTSSSICELRNWWGISHFYIMGGLVIEISSILLY